MMRLLTWAGALASACAVLYCAAYAYTVILLMYEVLYGSR